jgi:hypothetical protein
MCTDFVIIINFFFVVGLRGNLKLIPWYFRWQYGVNVKHQEYFADSPSTGMDPASRDE